MSAALNIVPERDLVADLETARSHFVRLDNKARLAIAWGMPFDDQALAEAERAYEAAQEALRTRITSAAQAAVPGLSATIIREIFA